MAARASMTTRSNSAEWRRSRGRGEQTVLTGAAVVEEAAEPSGPPAPAVPEGLTDNST
jgi:hypothetical protein